MAVHGKNGAVDIRYMFLHVADHVIILRGRGEAHGIRQVHRGSPGIDDRLDHLRQVVELRAAGVLGGELHVIHQALGETHPGHGHGDDLLLALLELELAVQRAGGQESVDAPAIARRCHGLRRPPNVILHAASQARNAALLHHARNGVHGLKVALRDAGETRLDDIDT